jgi:multiple sugar transport system permease protein
MSEWSLKNSLPVAVESSDISRKHRRVMGRDCLTQYWFIAPAVLILLLVGLFPTIYAFVASVQNVTMATQDYSWHGFGWYSQLFADKRFWQALWHTGLIAAFALPAEITLGLLLAVAFTRYVPARSILIAILIVPSVICPVIVGAIWRLMFDTQYGPITHILSAVLGHSLRISWVTSPAWVYPVILIAEIWQWTPFMFLILLAALSNVDQELLDAAAIDGAGFWSTFFQISLWVIWPVMSIAILIRALDLFRIFDLVFVLTKGGPGTLTETGSIYLYITGFQQFRTSYAGAMAVIIIVLLSSIVLTALNRIERLR